MIVLSRSLVLSRPAGISLSAPIILWDSIVDAGSITANSEDEAYPASNLATESTIEVWRAAGPGEVVIEIDTGGQVIDAIGFARTNFGTAHATVKVEALVDFPWVLATGFWSDAGFWRTDADPSEPTAWVEVIEEFMPADNSPLLLRLAPMPVSSLRITIASPTVPASAAVMFVGKLLVMPHGITAGHVPLDHAIDTQVVNGTSEAGNFLGRIVTGQSAQTSARFDYLPIDWFYDEMSAFVQRGASGPFFFAWMPKKRPQDVGYSWLTSDPQPVIGAVHADVVLNYGGIVR